MEIDPSLVLIDGQGLGHTPDTTTSVSTHITKRFDRVDAILIADNTKQPMQAGPIAVLRSIAAGGHGGKLVVAFTHFDHVEGPNLRTAADRRAHVMESMRNALSYLADDIGASVVGSIEHDIEDRCFMLGGIDRNLDQLPKNAKNYMYEQLKELVNFCKKISLPSSSSEAHPTYDPTGVDSAVRNAVLKFHDIWDARLGRRSHEA